MAIIPNSEFYRDEIYFACNQYHDDIINYFLYEAWDKSYSRTMSRQREFAKTMSRTIPLSDFVLDTRLNTRLKIPARSWTYRLDGFKLPIADKKRFVRRYGNFNKPVAMKSILQDGQTFGFSIDCSIGEYGYLDLYFYPTLYNYVYLLFIPTYVAVDGMGPDDHEIYESFDSNSPVPAGKVNISQFRVMQNDGSKMTLQWTRHGEVYKVSGRLANYINSSTLRVTIPKSAQFADFVKHDWDSNSWDLYVSDNPAAGVYLYSRGLSSVISIGEKDIVFQLPSMAFGKRNLSNTVGSIYLVHRPTRVMCIEYAHELGLAPIFQLSALQNPLNQVNYLISKYDRTTDRKLQTELLEVEAKYFPNVIDLTGTEWAEEDLMIEAYTLPKQDTRCLYENPLQNYMDAVGEEYASIVTDMLKCPAAISRYNCTLPIDANAYPYTPEKWKGNIRGYWMQMLNEVLQDNPMRYKDLQKRLDALNKRFIHGYGSPRELKFSSKYVMDNSDVAEVKKDDTTYFDELHGMVRYTSEEEDTPALMYVNGTLRKITVQYFCAGYMYNYLPKSVVDEAMERYENDEAIEMAEPMVIDAFPRFSTAATSNVSEIHRFYDTEDRQPIFENLEGRDTISINDLVFYDNSSMEYIDKSRLSFGFLVDQYTVDHEKIDDVVLLDKATSIEYLMTVLGEVYRTMNVQEIILRNADVSVSLDEFIQKLPGGLDSISNKEFLTGNLIFGIKDPSLIGVDIVVAIVNRYDNREFDGITCIDQDHKLYYSRFAFPADPRRIEIYHNGFLLPEENYALTFPKGIGGTLEIDFNAMRNEITPTSKFNIVCLPIPFTTKVWKLRDSNMRGYNFVTNEYNPVQNTFTGAGKNITLYELIPDETAVSSELINFKEARVFANGQRIAYHDREDIALINCFYIDDALRVRGENLDAPIMNWSTVNLIIKYPARDMDIFKMNRLMMGSMQQQIINP